MKKMIYEFFTSVVMITALVACQADDGVDGNGVIAMAVLSVSPEAIPLGATDATATVDVLSNRDWTVSTGNNEEWCKWSDTDLTGNKSITFTVEENTTASSRSVTLTFTTVPKQGEKALNDSVVITQEAGIIVDATLSISPTTTIALGTPETTTTIEVSSNRSWTISKDDDNKRWCKWSETNLTGNKSIIFTIEENKTESPRDVTLSFKTTPLQGEEVVTKSVQITQEASLPTSKYLTVSPSAINLVHNDIETVVKVVSDQEWTISKLEDADWCILPAVVIFTGDQDVTLTLEKNTTKADRDVTLVFTSNEDSELKKEVILTQKKFNSNKVTLRVVSWNIWKNNVVEHGEQAMTGTIDILKKLEADVILMQETEANYESNRAERIATDLGFEYHYPSRGSQTNLCIFSRYPILEKYGDGSGSHLSSYNLAGVKINVDGVHVRLFDAWLHYLPAPNRFPADKTPEEIVEWEIDDVEIGGYDYGSRDEEMNDVITELRPYLDEVNTVPVIIGGDLNSFSHLDWTEATKNLYDHKGKVVNWRISNIATDAGFKDSYREFYPNPATHPGTTHAGSANEEVNRIDYIYYQGESVKLVASKIYKAISGQQVSVKGESLFFGSDHGLVFSTFDIYREKATDGAAGNDYGDLNEVW